MKIIEAMKRVKSNREKITDLQGKIALHCANLSLETPLYGAETPDKITGWLQSCTDLTQENVRLLTAISRTNIATQATVELGGNLVTKSLAEWIWRRREYAKVDLETWQKLTDRGLREGPVQTSQGTVTEVKLVRFYDPNIRDARIAMFRSEPHDIDAALEVVNAVTELVE